MAVLAYPLHWVEALILSCYLRRPLLSETRFFAVAIMRAFLIWIHQETDEKWIVFCHFSRLLDYLKALVPRVFGGI